MFQTYPHAHIPSHPAFADAPFLWAEVEHDIHRPWFYVRILESGEDMQWPRMMLIGHERSLQSLMQAQSSKWLVESVLVATPAHMNGSGQWQFEPLELLQRYAHENSELTLVYTVKGGRIYVTGDALLATNGCSYEVLFEASWLGERSTEGAADSSSQ